MTQWPRGLAGYVPAGRDDATPSPEEDRTANRLRFVARLLSVLRAEGQDVDRQLRDLEVARAAYDGGDRGRAARLVDQLLADLDASHPATDTP